jgi:hypothetical protein
MSSDSAPGLFNTLEAATPSALASLKSLPTNTVEYLAVYLRILEDVSPRSSFAEESIADVHRIELLDSFDGLCSECPGQGQGNQEIPLRGLRSCLQVRLRSSKSPQVKETPPECGSNRRPRFELYARLGHNIINPGSFWWWTFLGPGILLCMFCNGLFLTGYQYAMLRERKNDWQSITDSHPEYIRFYNSIWLVCNDGMRLPSLQQNMLLIHCSDHWHRSRLVHHRQLHLDCRMDQRDSQHVFNCSTAKDPWMAHGLSCWIETEQ